MTCTGAAHGLALTAEPANVYPAPAMSGEPQSKATSIRVWSATTWSGQRLLAPVSDLSRATLGPDEQTERAMQRFLTSYLDKAPAQVLARFSLPEPVQLHSVRVVVPRLELPRRLQMDVPLQVHALVIPTVAGTDGPKQDVWVIVPALDHTFFVPKAEQLDDAIRSEVVRMAAVLKPEAQDYLDLFPAEHEELLTFEVELSEHAGGGADAKTLRRRLDNEKRRQALKVLESVARPLHRAPGYLPGPEPVGLDELSDRLKALLQQPQRSSVLLIGEPRCGKTELLWSALRLQAARERGVWATSGAQLIAGMSGLGQWQERVRRVMEAVETLDTILYIDDVTDLFGDQGHTIDIPSAMRPYMEGARTRVIAEVTPARLDKLEDRNQAFFAAFHRLRVKAQDRKGAEQALRQRLAFDSKHDPQGPRLHPSVLKPIVELMDRYFAQRPYPAKALRLYHSVRSLAVQARQPDGSLPEVGPEAVIEAFSLESGIPAFLLREDEALKEQQIRQAFARRLIGQSSAVAAVAQTICVVKAALQPAGKPLSTFLFVGPTGVGKTELARTLAGFLFGSEQRMTRFDMSEFSDPYAAERLIRGTENQEGLLTRRVRTQPFSVLLLDEIEKADRSVFDLLLQVIGEGRLTDTRGQTTYFHNTIIIMTSNLGAAHRSEVVGFDAQAPEDQDYYVEQVNRTFRPEFVNRLDRIIAFSPLSTDEVCAVVQLCVRRLEVRKGLTDRGIALQLSDLALQRLAEDGYSAAYGARAVRRHLDVALLTPLAQLLARAGAAAHGCTVWVHAEQEVPPRSGRVLGRLTQQGLQLTALEGQQKSARRDARHATQIAQMRRLVDQRLALDRVEQVRARRQMVRAELNVGGLGSAKARKRQQRQDRRRSADLSRLSQEHHRLQEVLQAAESARDELVVAEEVALMAVLAAEETAELYEAAVQATHHFERNLAYLLLAQQPARDEATLIVQPQSPAGALQLWLLPLLQALPARQWQAEVHFAGEAAQAHEKWPALRPWGPGRSAVEARERLQGDACQAGTGLLLRVRGPYAGALLALEQGLHRYDGRAKGGGAAELYIKLVALRYVFNDEADWSHAEMAPPTSAWRPRTKPIRRHRAAHDRLELSRAQTTLVMPLKEYWARFEEVAVADLLSYEADPTRDRDALFYGALEGGEGASQ